MKVEDFNSDVQKFLSNVHWDIVQVFLDILSLRGPGLPDIDDVKEFQLDDIRDIVLVLSFLYYKNPPTNSENYTRNWANMDTYVPHPAWRYSGLTCVSSGSGTAKSSYVPLKEFEDYNQKKPLATIYDGKDDE